MTQGSQQLAHGDLGAKGKVLTEIQPLAVPQTRALAFGLQ